MKRHWNYRLFKSSVGITYISEVHYEDGVAAAYSGPAPAASESDNEEEAVKQIRNELTKMLSALEKPVLTEGDFQ